MADCSEVVVVGVLELSCWVWMLSSYGAGSVVRPAALRELLPGLRHGTLPHGGTRPFNQKSMCLTQLTSRPNVVRIWSRNPRISEATKPSNSTEWRELLPGLRDGTLFRVSGLRSRACGVGVSGQGFTCSTSNMVRSLGLQVQSLWARGAMPCVTNQGFAGSLGVQAIEFMV